MTKKHHAAEKLMATSYEAMDERTQKVARHITERKHISRNTVQEHDETKTFGQRAADAVAKFGGSWAFIILFGVTLICWVILNSFILVNYNEAFDPYPYILLNLFLSMLASIQAPIILMSQNRLSEKDRLNAEHDYEVNLKAELEIMLLHEKVDLLHEKVDLLREKVDLLREKVDLLREGQWSELIAIQKEQLMLLGNLIEKNAG